MNKINNSYHFNKATPLRQRHAEKTLLLIIGFLMVFFFVNNAFSQTVVPRLIDVGASSIFIPEGFDDNDNTQIVFEGYFPNTCYRTAPTVIERDGNSIHVKPKAYFHRGPCFQMLVHYSHVIDLGVLKSGDYNITMAADDNRTDDILHVMKATNPGPDDFLYAPVKQATVVSKSPLTLRLRGEFSNTCMSLKDTIIYKSVSNVIVVLPIAEITESGGPCDDEEVPFVYDLPISQELNGRYLFHVRALNGTSLNTIETIRK